MCHIIHMLQSQQLILHEQQQTLKKKNCPVLKRKLSSCLHFKYAFKGNQFCILSLTDLFGQQYLLA